MADIKSCVIYVPWRLLTLKKNARKDVIKQDRKRARRHRRKHPLHPAKFRKLTRQPTLIGYLNPADASDWFTATIEFGAKTTKGMSGSIQDAAGAIGALHEYEENVFSAVFHVADRMNAAMTEQNAVAAKMLETQTVINNVRAFFLRMFFACVCDRSPKMQTLSPLIGAFLHVNPLADTSVNLAKRPPPS